MKQGKYQEIYAEIAESLIVKARESGLSSNLDFLTLCSFVAQELLIFVCSSLDLEGRETLMQNVKEDILSAARVKGGSLGLLASFNGADMKSRAEKDPEFKALLDRLGIQL